VSALSAKPTAIETIFFDLGGVLLTNGWDKNQRASVLPKFGVDLAEYEKRHDAANYYWERGLKGARWFFDQTVFYEPRTFTFNDLWPEVEQQSRLLYPETGEILGLLRGLRQFRIATLNNESRELNDYDIFICSGYAGEMKPGRAMYRTAREVSGAPAYETLFIDDKVENCEAARAVGMQAIHFTSPAALNSSLTEFGITL
jgi:HAD superfamily hydrolase (TIGR01509 family)